MAKMREVVAQCGRLPIFAMIFLCYFLLIKQKKVGQLRWKSLKLNFEITGKNIPFPSFSLIISKHPVTDNHFNSFLQIGRYSYFCTPCCRMVDLLFAPLFVLTSITQHGGFIKIYLRNRRCNFLAGKRHYLRIAGKTSSGTRLFRYHPETGSVHQRRPGNT